MHAKKAVLLLAILLLFPARLAWGLTIGTFNMEYFTLSGDRAYTTEDCRDLAEKILSSGVQVLALQEIEGDRTMERFVTTFLPHWEFAGIDTPSKQDLYFIWRSQDIALEAAVEPLSSLDLINWKGRVEPLFRRPPLKGVFRERRTGATFTMIDVHLRSLGTKGTSDRLAAVAMNNGIRQAQIVRLSRWAREIVGPLFILGDFNAVAIPGADFPLFPLSGDVSYDDLQCTIDHIGYVNVSPDSSWRIFTVETAIPRRSTRGRQHPDHDMVILSVSTPFSESP